MTDIKLFGRELKNAGFDFFSGVPCSCLKYLINFAINECEYIISANEGDAVAICSGAYLGGKKTVFLCQNSGLTNAVSPLSSLNAIFKIPVLGFVSLRGEPGIQDEPQHELMGRITSDMLDLLEIKWEYLSGENTIALEQLQRANSIIENGQTFFFIVREGTFTEEKLNEQEIHTTVNIIKTVKNREDALPSREDALRTISSLKDDNTILIATTGKTGRELYTTEDSPNNLYMVGSMGCVSSMALGLALSKPDKKVVAIDGDGAIIMRLGSLSTNAYYAPENMIHILLDNNSHDSTGGQLTLSHNIDFVNLCASMGYYASYYAHDTEELSEIYKKWNKNKGLTFIHLKINKGAMNNLGRPKIKPHDVQKRLCNFIEGKI